MHRHRPARPDGRAAQPPRTAAPLPPAGLLALQRQAGNAALVRYVQQAREAEQHQHDGACGHQVQRATAHDVLAGAGQPLAGPLRTEMESRLGADFSDVRLHTGGTAQRSAAELGARAYTSGNHVVLGAGGADKHTLAHELTHVIQQRRGPVAGADNGQGLAVSDPGDRFERAAEANAHRVMSGPVPEHRPEVQRAAAPSAATPAVQRYTERPDISPQARLSQNHGILLRDSTEAYASAQALETANQALTAAEAAQIVLEAGPALEAGIAERAGVQGLRRVIPVYKRAGPGREHDPVRGESPEQRGDKLRAYQGSLVAVLRDIAALEADLKGKRIQKGEVLSHLTRLSMRVMGQGWLEANQHGKAVFTDTSKAAEKAPAVLRDMVQAYSRKLSQELAPELTLDQLMITLPNDCKQTASKLTGRDANALNNEAALDPEIGSNYSISFNSKGSWGQHYASVVMKDGGDNLTYEAAAKTYVPVPQGKTVGFFALYGTAQEQQSFRSQLHLSHRRHCLYSLLSILHNTELYDPPARERAVLETVGDLRDLGYQPLQGWELPQEYRHLLPEPDRGAAQPDGATVPRFDERGRMLPE
ncbi:DUF4157 domain-containing protein [Kitasatospora viridis]|uniref:Uncharacterized protein DUF4157 n=1 Tax=Kitasatospora viridis TaxID=281105 RepID=A0A561UPM6_9ACTN|nr:DUF4157 domain-containing protein [Kitasatospora viridis]TWG01294.1 uncharacterized protein DUF4157 [Kitasatospora viridis]